MRIMVVLESRVKTSCDDGTQEVVVNEGDKHASAGRARIPRGEAGEPTSACVVESIGMLFVQQLEHFFSELPKRNGRASFYLLERQV